MQTRFRIRAVNDGIWVRDRKSRRRAKIVSGRNVCGVNRKLRANFVKWATRSVFPRVIWRGATIVDWIRECGGQSRTYAWAGCEMVCRTRYYDLRETKTCIVAVDIDIFTFASRNRRRKTYAVCLQTDGTRRTVE